MSGEPLRQAVIDELDFAPDVDATGIGVATSDGIVTLTGHVSSYAQKVRAGRLARQVKGVRAIADEIEVRYPHEKKVADDEIAKRALAILRWEGQAADSIMVEVAHGWVTLTGDVTLDYQRVAAEDAVYRLSGVIGVTNAIRLKSKVTPGDVRGAILEALDRQAGIDARSIMIVVHDDRVTLLGKAKTWRERSIAERTARSIPGVTSVEDRLDVG